MWRWCYRAPLIDPPHISELIILQPFLNQTQKFKSTSFVPMLYRDVNLFLCSLKSYQIPSYQSIGKGPMLMILVHVIKANNHFIGVVGHKIVSDVHYMELESGFVLVSPSRSFRCVRVFPACGVLDVYQSTT